MAEPSASAADAAMASASATLSQLGARILEQLALSAWLPSAALTLLGAFTFQLGAVLDTKIPPVTKGGEATYIHSPGVAISKAFQELGQMSVGGLLLLVVVVIVLTMLTQAFSFESIRILEGYWGTGSWVERLAKRRCTTHRQTRLDLESSLRALTREAWNSAYESIKALQQELDRRGKPLPLTDNVISAMREKVLRERPTVTLNDAEKKRLAKTDWKAYADPELLRRRVNVQKRLRDYPADASILPTRLGNVLRHHEDRTGYVEVESLVEDSFDQLPFSVRLTHDERRSRLDLYCSMVFVYAAAACIAVARFGVVNHWGYSLAAVGLGVAGSGFSYRAGVASARAYGSSVITIARYLADHPANTAPAPV